MVGLYFNMSKSSIYRSKFSNNYNIKTIDVYNSINNQLFLSLPNDIDNFVIEIAYSAGANIPTIWSLSPNTLGSTKLLPGNGWATNVIHYDGIAPSYTNNLNFTVNMNGTGITGNPSLVWAKIEIGYKKNINAITPTVPSYYTSYTEYFYPGSYIRNYNIIQGLHW